MQLDKLTVDIRPLPPYQALDLGLAMARAWRTDLYAFWHKNRLFVALAIYALLSFLVGVMESYEGFIPLWVLLVVVVVMRVNVEVKMMMLLSQKVFDDNANTNTAMIALKAYHKPTLTALKYVLSPSRIVIMAVALLENQQGINRKKRLKMLMRAGGGNAIWRQSLMFFVIELIVFFGLLSLCLMMVSLTPLQAYSQQSGLDFLLTNANTDVVTGTVLGLYLVVVYLLTPFFVASSFALYLCRRSLLEGWDIELEFRKMRERYLALQHTQTPHKGQKND